MDFLQSDWFAWTISIIVIGGLLATWWESLDDSGHMDVVWYLVKQSFMFVIGILLLPIIIPIKIFSEKK